jgi:cytochrome c
MISDPARVHTAAFHSLISESRMKSRAWVLILSASLLSGIANAVIPDSDGTKLMSKYNCQACHALDKKLVGPSFKDVAHKYAGEADAVQKLEGKVKNGGSGAWGPIPMPPNNVPATDLDTLVEWIVSLK